RLSTLSSWSQTHIKNVFEARTDEACLRAMDTTFSQKITATLNGSPLSREAMAKVVLAMRNSAKEGLSVDWRRTEEWPSDSDYNREGAFAGVYVIRGLRKPVPESEEPVEYERHKSVNVVIQSESSDPTFDSRMITSLTFVATDVRIEQPR
ncbi:hypothetical protein JAAARDRAFT_92720, partial [Jaapia argillacea MUCL 33604]